MMNQQQIPFPGGGYVTPFFDLERIRAFDAVFKREMTTNHSVLEVAPGSGVLSFLAAKYASKIIAIEDDESLLEIFKKCTNSLSERTNIEIVKVDNLHEYDSREKFDFVICEILSPALLLQPQMPLVNRFRRYLRPGGSFIPYGITNFISLVEANFSPYGISFRYPYRERIDLPISLSKTNNTIMNHFKFKDELPISVQSNVTLATDSDGITNAIRIESIVHVSEDVLISGRAILCTPIVIPLNNDFMLKNNRKYRVFINYSHATDLVDFPDINIDIESD